MVAGVEFDEDKFAYQRPSHAAAPSSLGYMSGPATATGLSKWLMDKHIAKSANGAQAVLIGIVVVNVIITFIIIKFFI